MFAIATEARIRQRLLDSEEFRLITTYDVGHHAGGAYRAFANVDQYVAHRDKCFGSTGSYLLFAMESDKELTDSMRAMINPPDRRPNTAAEEQKAKAIFWRWLRLAYKKKFNPENVAADLEARLKDYKYLERFVKDDGKLRLQPAFCPRPERKADPSGTVRYILGTVSDHSRGIAVDLDPAHNPDVPLAAWTFISRYVDMRVDRSLNRWIRESDGLVSDIKRMSDRFRDKIKSEADLVTQYQAFLNHLPGAQSMPSVIPIPFGHGAVQSKAGYLLNTARAAGKDPFPGKKDVDKYIQSRGAAFFDSKPLDVVLDTALSDYAGDKPQKGLLKKLANGFFSIEPDVVRTFRTFGFTWGVTFPQPDIMHFARDGKTPPGLGDFNALHTTTA